MAGLMQTKPTPRPPVIDHEWVRPPRMREAIPLRRYRMVTEHQKRRWRAGRDVFFLALGFVLARLLMSH